MNIIPALLLACISSLAIAQTKKADAPIHELRIYHHNSAEQGKRLDAFLEKCVLPALHQQGLKDIGIFTAISNDTAKARQTYMLISYSSLRKKLDIESKIMSDKWFIDAAKEFMDSARDKQAYTRMEGMLMRGFRMFPGIRRPSLTGSREQRIYELRSYESTNERLYWNKVEMFNEGGEIALFDRLGFNAVFYGEVFSGPRMPNLMYMTTFENKADRDAHWQSFRDDAEWKQLSSNPKYQKNVSRSEIIFLRPTAYSDY
jgi:hypothetical protein